MSKVEVLKSYWSKSQAFLLPLTGLSKTHKYPLRTYLFWENYTIEDYQLIIKFTYDNCDEFLEYCRRIVFPMLGSSLVETYDHNNETVMIVDISVWALDIELFLRGKYSKLSEEAKGIITAFHTFYNKNKPQIAIEISASLWPNDEYKILDNMTAIDYVAQEYKLPLEELKKVGELGGIFDRKNETLTGFPVNVTDKS